MISSVDTRGETENWRMFCSVYSTYEDETTTQENFESRRREKLTDTAEGCTVLLREKVFPCAQLDSLGFQFWNFEFLFCFVELLLLLLLLFQFSLLVVVCFLRYG